MPPKLTGQREADTAHYRRIERYVALIEAIFDLSASRTASLVSGVEHDPEKLFKFSQHPELKARIDALMSALAADVQAVIVNGATAEWENSNVKSDALVRSFLGDHADEERFKKYFNNNSEALAQFIKRKDSGMNLSTRVWNLTQAHKRDLEIALSVGLGDGRSADELSRDIRKYLRDPDKLFRRVRDKFGNLVLSKPARAYKPGAGVYRSSYKNAVRLARTEINMSYKASDHARWQQLDFVVGYEVKRSQRKYPCDVCESLKGKYPKTFKFVSWHPNCRCYVVPILMTDDEFWAESETSVNEVKDVPDGFKQWVADNKDRIVAAEKDGRLPYFLRDNSEFVKFDDNITLNVPSAESVLPKNIFDKFHAKDLEKYNDMVSEGEADRYLDWLSFQQGSAEINGDADMAMYYKARYTEIQNKAIVDNLAKYNLSSAEKREFQKILDSGNSSDVWKAAADIRQRKVSEHFKEDVDRVLSEIRQTAFSNDEKAKLESLYLDFNKKRIAAESEHDDSFGSYKAYANYKRDLELKYFKSTYQLSDSEQAALDRYFGATSRKISGETELGNTIGGRFVDIESDNASRNNAFGKQYSIPKDELGLISRYTYGSGFASRYVYVGGYKDELVEDYMSAASGIVRKLPKYNGRTYAGLSFKEDAGMDFINDMIRRQSQGQPYELKCFQSATTSINKTNQFIAGKNPVMLVIDGKTGVDIKPLARKTYMDEDEILHNIGSKFRVKKVVKESDSMVRYHSNSTFKDGQTIYDKDGKASTFGSRWLVFLEEI